MIISMFISQRFTLKANVFHKRNARICLYDHHGNTLRCTELLYYVFHVICDCVAQRSLHEFVLFCVDNGATRVALVAPMQTIVYLAFISRQRCAFLVPCKHEIIQTKSPPHKCTWYKRIVPFGAHSTVDNNHNRLAHKS